jgi:hypothetical protein
MTWNLVGQYLNFVVAFILIIRILSLKLYSNYRALIVFVTYESFQAVVYLILRYFTADVQEFLDYRLVWGISRWIAWGAEIWMVYALLIAILKHLPGILRFSLRILNVAFVVAILVALATVRPQYRASSAAFGNDLMGKFTNLNFALERATAFGLLLAILFILSFVLFFPIRVPRNLAVVSTGLCLALFVRISLILIKIYLSALDSPFLAALDQLVTVGCMTYWALSLSKSGEEASVTLGRGWQTVPQDRLVRQLESMNASLLRSRE